MSGVEMGLNCVKGKLICKYESHTHRFSMYFMPSKPFERAKGASKLRQNVHTQWNFLVLPSLNLLLCVRTHHLET